MAARLPPGCLATEYLIPKQNGEFKIVMQTCQTWLTFKVDYATAVGIFSTSDNIYADIPQSEPPGLFYCHIYRICKFFETTDG